MICYCGSNQPFDQCCQPFLNGDAYPDTAEALMRSRYSAFCTMNTQYLNQTIAGPALAHATATIPHHHWINLSILSVTDGQIKDMHGSVEFKATFEQDGEFFTMHEHSLFEKIHGRWFYTDSK